MRVPTVILLLLVSMSAACLARIIRSAERKVPDFIMPVSHVKLIKGEYVTFKDKQLGDSSSQESKERACIPRDQAGQDEGLQTLKKVGEQNAEDDSNEMETTTRVFNDTTPFNGTAVEEEVIKLQVFKPLCDD